MARSAAGRRPKPVTPAQKGRRQPPPPRPVRPEDTMFFPRLRNHAKWMFVFLALVFGVGFVMFGVGSSLPSGLGDILGGTSSTGEASISEAQKEVEKNPKDPQAQLDLSRAYQRDGNLDAAIPPLAKFTTLQPRNQDGLQELAGLYTSQANKAQEVAGLANQEYQAAAGITALVSGTTQQLFQAGPLDQAILDDVSKRGQEANGKASTAFVNAAATYGKLTKLSPKDAQLWFLYGLSAESANKSADAITAYKQFVKLSPDAPEAPQVKARIKALQQQSSGVVSSGGITRINR